MARDNFIKSRFTIEVHGTHPFSYALVHYATMGFPPAADNKDEALARAREMMPDMAEQFHLNIMDGETLLVCFYKQDGKVIEEVPTLIGDGEPEFIVPI